MRFATWQLDDAKPGKGCREDDTHPHCDGVGPVEIVNPGAPRFEAVVPIP